MNEAEIKHLEFIQNIITRMNSNSFQIKNWAITILTALMALFGSSENNFFLFIAFLPCLLFWFLDAYYLQQERIFRGIYNDVAKLSESPQNQRLFELNTSLYKGGDYGYLKSFFSITILKTYPPLIFLVFSLHFVVSGSFLPIYLDAFSK
ncbi:TPA: hypothetical protein ACQJO5_002937 [Vibrio parahaemolyticus]|nr:hypothetical protein [Vibrio parahaemolyticus]HAS3033918.1 hypothetical protein [Vibrio parahaemolyticus]HAS3039501.1 hypothetical protein [Vibrio parahaemolyticus]HAS3055687.1 hypothetical protein [Vibrio parahaemolyticus]HAS3066310.1 hypothetical protein [Vibrio parahaemolyticus]